MEKGKDVLELGAAVLIPGHHTVCLCSRVLHLPEGNDRMVAMAICVTVSGHDFKINDTDSAMA